MANLVLCEATDSELHIYIENLDLTYWNNYGTSNLPRHDTYTISLGNTSIAVAKDTNAGCEGETMAASFTGLSGGTTYTVTATVAYYNTSGIPGTSTFSSNFSTTGGRPSNFSWDTTKTQGNSFNVTASEWNRLIDKVKEFHVYVLGSYNSTSYPMTKVTSGSTFYATRFNEVRFAIGSLNSTGISNKSTGDTITASDLNTIVSALNNID